MDKHPALCGLECSTCPLYIATANNDDKLTEKMRVEWGKQYKRDFTTADMECHGCRSKKKFKLCALCDIKDCCKRNNTSECLNCSHYPCERLQRLYQYQEDNHTGLKKSHRDG